MDDRPLGYLFLCPETHFQTGPASFGWPDSPAYWSLDPTGLESLSSDDAEALGFPSLDAAVVISVKSWDASVYAGLRQFQAAKGFDPDSQDVARHLGYPLYQPIDRQNPTPYVHIDTPEDSVNVDEDPEIENISVLESPPSSEPPVEDSEVENRAQNFISRLLRGVRSSLEVNEEDMFGSLV
ncbi:hypothetical protein C8R46DRAFT_49299 [Mycena filopes]|nr:hypothetical protein C8R46DRAFT_49299 [Mycena filopes]